MLGIHFRTDKLLPELDDFARAESDRGIDVETYDSPRCHVGEQMAVEILDSGQSLSTIYLNTESARAFFERNPHLSNNEALQQVIKKVKELTKRELAARPAKSATPLTTQKKASIPSQDKLSAKLELELERVCKLFKKYLPKNFCIDLEKVRMNEPRVFQNLIDDYGDTCFLWPSEKAALSQRLSMLQKTYPFTQESLRRLYPDVVFKEDGTPDLYA